MAPELSSRLRSRHPVIVKAAATAATVNHRVKVLIARTSPFEDSPKAGAAPRAWHVSWEARPLVSPGPGDRRGVDSLEARRSVLAAQHEQRVLQSAIHQRLLESQVLAAGLAPGEDA